MATQAATINTIQSPDRSGPVGGLLPRWAAAILLALLTTVVYWPSLTGDFLLDDDLLLVSNGMIKDPAGLYRYWFTFDPIDYWPVSNSNLWIEWRLWGPHPLGYHITNLLCHIAVALLIWAVLRRLSIPGAYLAALLFAIHPVNVDTVAWVSQRKTILAMLFFLLSILWYLKADPPGSPETKRFFSAGPSRWYWLSLVSFALAMLSKGSAAALPLVLLLVIWWHRKRITDWDLARIVPFFLVAVPLVIVNMLFQDHYSHEPIRTVTFWQRLAEAGATPWFYLSKAVWPLELIFIYPLWQIRTDDVNWWLPLIASLVVTAILWWQRNAAWGRPLLFAWAFYWLALGPVLGFADISYMKWSLVADHYQYIALVAVTAVVAAGLVWLIVRSEAGTWVGSGLAVALIGALAVLSWRQSDTYRDLVVLYQTTIEKNPSSSQAHYNLGELMFQRGEFEEAIRLTKEAAHLDPKDVASLHNIGASLVGLGRLQEAITSFEQALAIDPDALRTHLSLANVLYDQGEIQEATKHYEQALALEPKSKGQWINLGIALLRTGRPEQAIAYLQEAAHLKPNDPDSYNNLGAALLDFGKPREAMEQFDKALTLKPDFAQAENNLGKALFQLGETNKALEHYQRAVALKPDFVEAHNNLGLILARLGQPQAAIDQFQQALKLKPDEAETQNNLGVTLLSIGQPAEAAEHFEIAVRLRPNFLQAWSSLAAAQVRLNHRVEAIAAAERALSLARSQGQTAMAAQIEASLAMLRGQGTIAPQSSPSPPNSNPTLPPSP